MNKNFFKNKSLLITGGTGSFGKALVNHLLINKFPLKKIIIFSRDEFKQYEMQRNFGEKYKNLRFFLGDIRDKDRLNFAFKDNDIVIHAAALKQVSTAEYNPIEFIKTNVLGSQNVIEACLNSSVKNVIALSTDKASSPINLYGATKLCSDKLFISSNNIKGNKDVRFSVVRYGNVMGSRGSVLQNFLDQKKRGKLLVTDKEMTRFHIILEDAVSMVIHALVSARGGEMFVPKLPSFYVMDLARAVCLDCKIEMTGIRPGEKLHEEMISMYESSNTFDFQKYYLIIPNNFKKNSYGKIKFKPVEKNFIYNSKTNKDFLSIKDLKKIIHNCLEI
jgi:UDP-N-acetylglucosamine 4,6-dehydratase (inverting)